MKYWSSELILLHTDSQTPRQYPQKKSDIYLYSNYVFRGIKLGQYYENLCIRTGVRGATDTGQAFVAQSVALC